MANDEIVSRRASSNLALDRSSMGSKTRESTLSSPMRVLLLTLGIAALALFCLVWSAFTSIKAHRAF
jgi:hypothetical protein